MKQIKTLNDNEFLDDNSYYYLKPIDSPEPRFYGQPKETKPGVSICCIVPYSKFSSFNINKYIANILKAYAKDERNNANNSTIFPTTSEMFPLKTSK